MPAGIIIRNPGNELVFTSDAFVYHYLGTATLQSTAASPTTIPGGTYTLTAGYSTYTVNHSGSDIMVAVPMAAGVNSSVAIVSKVKSGSTWTITVQRGNGSAPNAAGFLTETSTTVHVWGKPVSTPNFGLAIYAPDGSLRADMSKKPLLIGEFLSFASGQATATLSGSYTTPGIMTSPTGGQETTSGSAGNYTITERLARWHYSGGVVTRERVQERRYFPEDVFINSSYTPPVQALIVELAGL
jgi:hypothetical protein